MSDWTNYDCHSGWLLAERAGWAEDPERPPVSVLLDDILGAMGAGARDQFARVCDEQLDEMPLRRHYDSLKFHHEFLEQAWAAGEVPDGITGCEVLIEIAVLDAAALAITTTRHMSESEASAARLEARVEARRGVLLWCYGQIAKIAGLNDDAVAVVAGLIGSWDRPWQELVDAAAAAADRPPASG